MLGSWYFSWATSSFKKASRSSNVAFAAAAAALEAVLALEPVELVEPVEPAVAPEFEASASVRVFRFGAERTPPTAVMDMCGSPGRVRAVRAGVR